MIILIEYRNENQWVTEIPSETSRIKITLIINPYPYRSPGAAFLSLFKWK
jgi:hypothetical protein